MDAEFSPDGKRNVTAADDGNARRRCARRFAQKQGTVTLRWSKLLLPALNPLT
jgi:hypothetical protein